jgi:hypothetical protein
VKLTAHGERSASPPLPNTASRRGAWIGDGFEIVITVTEQYLLTTSSCWFLRNVGRPQQDCMVLHPRRQCLSGFYCNCDMCI